MKKFIFLILFLPGIANAYTIQNGMRSEHTIPENYQIKCTPVSPYYYHSALIDVVEFKKTYSKKALSFLNKIIFCKDLHIGRFGFITKWARGTYDWKQKWIFVKIDDNQDSDYVLHHEFSSILMKQNKIKIKSDWIKHNQGKYNHDYGKANNYNPRHLEKIYKQGWYRDYSQSSFENDFNIIAGHYFTDWLRKKLIRTASRHWIIDWKMYLMMQWYKKKGFLR
jgi:hypothetical protein